MRAPACTPGRRFRLKAYCVAASCRLDRQGCRKAAASRPHPNAIVLFRKCLHGWKHTIWEPGADNTMGHDAPAGVVQPHQAHNVAASFQHCTLPIDQPARKRALLHHPQVGPRALPPSDRTSLFLQSQPSMATATSGRLHAAAAAAAAAVAHNTPKAPLSGRLQRQNTSSSEDMLGGMLLACCTCHCAPRRRAARSASPRYTASRRPQ